MLINCVVRWPGAVHDARILRNSDLFEDFEGGNYLTGVILGDSGYMVRDWLMTPLRDPTTRQERAYQFAQSSTRSTVERTIGVAKQRFQCLRYGLRLQPPKACKVISGKDTLLDEIPNGHTTCTFLQKDLVKPLQYTCITIHHLQSLFVGTAIS